MGYAFSSVSRRRLNTCDMRLQILSQDVIEMVDFSVITGHRTKEEQNELYPRYSKVKWPNSKHNSEPSRAIDVAPYLREYGALFGSAEQITKIQRLTGKTNNEINDMITKAYARLIGTFEAFAHMRDIDIRVGLDWDGDYDTLDQKFHDLGHIELL